MRHANPPARSFPSPWLKWLAASLAAGPTVLFIPSARGAEGAAAAPAVARPAPVAPAPPATAPAPPVVVEVVPAADPAPPADAPAGRAAAARPSRILVLPFSTVSGQAADAWLGRSIRQSVLTDLMTSAPSQVITATEPAADPAAAAEIGRKLGAGYVVMGEVHVNAGAVRVTGQILSADNGQAVATLKATGSMNQLFPIEDLLGEQARRALGRLQLADGGAGAAPAVLAQPPVIEASGPVQVAPPEAAPQAPYTYVPYPVSPTYPQADYGYEPYAGYSYPDYGYPYYPSYFYGGIGFVGRGFGGRDFGGRGFSGGGHFGGGHFGGVGHVGGGGHLGGVGHAGGGHGGGGHR